MDPSQAGRAARALEVLHSTVYFAPEVARELVALGLDRPAMQYFGMRAAPFGAVGPGLVTATFYSFAPRAVAGALPAVWQIADPEAVLAARQRGIDAVYTRVLGEDVLAGAEMAEAAEIATSLADAIDGVGGRPLYGANADLPWPDRPHLALWHALTLLREYRGDGHIAAAQTAGLSGLEALVTHTASGIGFAPEFARRSRGWTQDEWRSCEDVLRERGLLDRRGDLTGEGFEVRELVEDLTDDLAAAPWGRVGEDRVERLLDLTAPWCDSLVREGGFPREHFGPRWGDPR